MTVATLKDVLRLDRAIAGLVVLGWEEARAFVEAADETGIPIILQAGPGARAYTPTPILGKIFRHLAEHSRVPVVCHIDHAHTIDECVEGIDHGFSSVMIDGSKLPIAENIALTQRVVARAKPAGVSVEGEVGQVGYISGAASAMTSPEEASLFDREAGADALAISVGNVHLNTEKTNGIDWAALRAIEAVTTLPLVLHGGSGIPLEERRKLAHETRVAKFNFGTELRMTFAKALRKSLKDQTDSFDRIALLQPTIDALRDETSRIIKNIY
jgi:fructose-bisphosphate aldolase class II